LGLLASSSKALVATSGLEAVAAVILDIGVHENQFCSPRIRAKPIGVLFDLLCLMRKWRK
jgi:hypothetical protein